MRTLDTGQGTMSSHLTRMSPSDAAQKTAFDFWRISRVLKGPRTYFATLGSRWVLFDVVDDWRKSRLVEQWETEADRWIISWVTTIQCHDQFFLHGYNLFSGLEWNENNTLILTSQIFYSIFSQTTSARDEHDDALIHCSSDDVFEVDNKLTRIFLSQYFIDTENFIGTPNFIQRCSRRNQEI